MVGGRGEKGGSIGFGRMMKSGWFLGGIWLQGSQISSRMTASGARGVAQLVGYLSTMLETLKII